MTLTRSVPLPSPSHRSPLWRSSPALGLLVALLLPACDVEPDDGPPRVAEDADIERLAPEAGELPPLSDQELAAAQARTIASLPVQDAGRVEIVNAATDDAPNYVYIVVGGRLIDDVLTQLVVDQEATPAEVFLALAGAGEALPAALLADHRAAADGAQEPRRLTFVTPRTIENDHHDCLGSGVSPKPFNSWVNDWRGRFGLYFNPSTEVNAQNTADGGTSYFVSVDSNGRVLSACNASHNDLALSLWAYTAIPGDFYPFSLLWSSNTIDSFDAVHLFSTGGGPLYRMYVYHGHPDPRTYVAMGRCAGPCS